MTDILPVIDVNIKDKRVGNTYIDGGAQICVMSKAMMLWLGFEVDRPSPCKAKMAKNSKMKCVGIVSAVKVKAFNTEVEVDVFVIPTKGEGYPLILGRPWLMAMQAKQAGSTGLLRMIGKKGEAIYYNMRTGKQRQMDLKTLADETTSESSTSEEDTFIEESDNSIDVMGIIMRDLQGVNTPGDPSLEVQNHMYYSGGTSHQVERRGKASCVETTPVGGHTRKGTPSRDRKVEPKVEKSDEVDAPKPLQVNKDRVVPNTIENTFRDFPPYVPIVEEQWPREMWKAVREAKGDDDEKPAPLTEMGNDGPQPEMDHLCSAVIFDCASYSSKYGGRVLSEAGLLSADLMDPGSLYKDVKSISSWGSSFPISMRGVVFSNSFPLASLTAFHKSSGHGSSTTEAKHLCANLPSKADHRKQGVSKPTGAKSVVFEESKVFAEGSVNQAGPRPLTAFLEDESNSSSEQSFIVMSIVKPGVEAVSDTQAIGTSRMAEEKDKVIVKWEEDRWVDEQGRNFFRAQHPNEVNPFGELQGALIDPKPEERPPVIREASYKIASSVLKVDVDQEDVGIYKCFDFSTSTACYYKCLDPRTHELTKKKILYMYMMEKHQDQDAVMVDKYRRQYIRTTMEELAGLTIPGQPLEVVLRPSKARTLTKDVGGKFSTSMSTLKIGSDLRGKEIIHA
ncbi:hypothetical protein L7F22_035103 [Adiantum nelumboides]|nr:hypothetical protein [Adiantum nelumboides]